MQSFKYNDDILQVERCRLTDIAEQFGTPCYVYSKETLQQNWLTFNAAFDTNPHTICYAVKANSNIAILNLLAKLDSGFDIVSLGELERVIIAKGDPNKIIFSGIGKQITEIERALALNIYCFNIESASELEKINAVAATQNRIAPIALRVNPDVDAKTHPYIATGLHENKFGIPHEEVIPLIEKIGTLPHLQLIGIACHIGSQLTSLAPFIDAIERLTNIIDRIHQLNISLKHIDVGGGLGVNYQGENPPEIASYVHALCQKLSHYPYKIIIEPGRAIVANAGILLTRLLYLKYTSYKNFAIVDAAMNDFLRPALYNAWHEILPVHLKSHLPKAIYDIAGPICESADFLGKQRTLQIEENDLLAITNVGAYGFTMSSNYNSRPRAAEVLVDRTNCSIIREREKLTDLFKDEKILS